MTITTKRVKDLNEYITPAAQTLTNAQKTQQKNDDEVELLARFMKLNNAQKARHVEFLQKSLSADGNDAWSKGAGVGDDVAAKNRQGLKDNPNKNRKSLADIKKAAKKLYPDVSEKFQEEAAEAFFEAQIPAAREALFEMISELLNNDPTLALAFADDATLAICEAYALRIEELTELCEAAEFERDMLVREARAALEEGTIYVVPKKRRSTHNLADDFAPNEDNAVLLETDQQQHGHHMDKRMQSYLKVLERTTKNVDMKTASSALHETWNIVGK
jgi:hypothetical protein